LECVLLSNTKITDDTYFEETNNTFYSIHQEINEEQIIKSIKININVYMKKDRFQLSHACDTINKFYRKIFYELNSLNSSKSYTYSLYSVNNNYNSKITQQLITNANVCCPIPLGVLYSSDENFDENDPNQQLHSQILYFDKIFNLKSSQNACLKKCVLEQNVNEKLISICDNEMVKDAMGKNNFNRIKNIHLEMILTDNNINKCNSIEGDYYYFYTLNNDKAWGGGYRALQTLISWYILNGKAKLEIPNLNDIKSHLIYLGRYSSKSFKANHNRQITLTDLAMVIGYLIDTKTEIISHPNTKELMKIIHNNLLENKSPIVISFDSYIMYTIIGVDLITERLLILNHLYSGKPALFYIIKANVCKWITVNELFDQQYEKVEVMLHKFNT
jgi:hypothetical protein